jgi:hypothetical protein
MNHGTKQNKTLKDICDLFAKFDLPVKSARVGSYRRAIQKFKQAAEGQRHLNDRDRTELLNSLIDVRELGIICSVVRLPPILPAGNPI